MSTPIRVTDPKHLEALKWRCIGPARGGRVVAVAGDPNEPMVFYFGACAGGVWKTIDGGVYWRCISDGYFSSASVGALAVARSDSNVIYVGMGETTIRNDVSYGDGVYRSTDAGRSWIHLGLKDTRHIGKICIHPHDPDIVFVAALGDAFGPNEERGVFRSKDGGKTWQKVLDRGPDAGAVDISMDANNPRILLATIWQTRRNFWNLSSGGPGSGLFRSLDGGDSWEELSGRNGLPDGPLGKLGVSVSEAQSGRAYALIEAEGDRIGLYRTDDHGDHWIQVSQNRDLMHRPFYYTHVFADPRHADTVYVNNLQMWKSSDGGVNFAEVTTPHPDNHDLWIDPANPKRMIQGNDGGACVTFNGGTTWSSIYNQMTAQFYRIDVDNQYPYRVYATQQDNTAISVPSASEWGVIPLGDCTYPGTGESGFIVVDPKDPNIVYCGAIGSSPGSTSALQRYDHRTRQIRVVNVWPEYTVSEAPKNMRYRFGWTFPIAFSPHDAKTLYAGGNHVFRSRDEGSSWTAMSPDLSLNDPVRQDYSGGILTRDNSGAEVHATCASLMESPHRKGEIWASTDDGLVHVTRNEGTQWSNVTPKQMPELAYVGCLEISPHDAETVYVAATRYKLSDYRPCLFRTKDGGKSWQSINGNFPQAEITRVLRADPIRSGLLFVGTETGVFFSLDDGTHWSRMAGGLPIVPVYDLKIKGSDLVVGTHGRSFWILDDITPLRELDADQKDVKLMNPRSAIRTKLAWAAGQSFSKVGISKPGIGYMGWGIGAAKEVVEFDDGRSDRRYLDCGENPPDGAIINYWLASDAEHPIKLTFQDARGDVITSFSSDDKDIPLHSKLGTKAGLNRFVWDLRYPGAAQLDRSLETPKYKALAAEREDPSGPAVIPGSYRVRLETGDKDQIVSFSVVKDPRVVTTEKEFAEQFALLQELFSRLSALNQTVNHIRLMKRQMADMQKWLGEKRTPLGDRAQALAGQLEAIEGALIDIKQETPLDQERNPPGLKDKLVDLISVVAVADEAPTQPARQVADEIVSKVDAEIKKFDAGKEEAAALNLALRSAGVEPIGIGRN
ncbi:sialidase family protein [Mesorhizobium sp. NZP2077]|uniref:WD40/YVTN/BNR-like repeat-containing protein n=1 Tax=Mesorhizobium sp. NZP2077 TaxID=2483404 RepID=UPI0015551B35|nr:sialidase family protein [Mesorhizobium sp. NZP2077]QKC86846.1 glycosyl hydrolase [Mesorhizobium sp. NZP2077]QKD20552.1 glycosyl hydrolase [Mesorhizobium sp. NZP2077]